MTLLLFPRVRFCRAFAGMPARNSRHYYVILLFVARAASLAHGTWVLAVLRDVLLLVVLLAVRTVVRRRWDRWFSGLANYLSLHYARAGSAIKRIPAQHFSLPTVPSPPANLFFTATYLHTGLAGDVRWAGLPLV